MHTATNPQTRVVNLTSLPYGWQELPEYSDHVFVGRRDDRLRCDGYFGNPFTVGKDFPDFGVVNCSRAQSPASVQNGVSAPHVGNEDFAAKVRALAGKMLVASDTCCTLVLAHVADTLAA